MNRVLGCAALIAWSLIPEQAGALERLFTTPEQRYQLGRTIKKQPEPIETTTAESKPSLQLDGFVKTPVRNTIWINGRIEKPGASQAYSMLPGISPAHNVTVTVQGERIRLRPGQALIDKRVIKDVYESRDTDEDDNTILLDGENAEEASVIVGDE